MVKFENLCHYSQNIFFRSIDYRYKNINTTAKSPHKKKFKKSKVDEHFLCVDPFPQNTLLGL